MRDFTTRADSANEPLFTFLPGDGKGGFESIGRIMLRILEAAAEGVTVADVESRQRDYQEYLQTPHWHQLRARILRRAGGRCEKCHVANVTLEVHHMTYARRGAEDEADVIALCGSCHQEVHR